jgi:hypothetical protein
MASLRVDAALLDGEPVVRGAAPRSFGNAALGDRGGIPFSTGAQVFQSVRGLIWQLFWIQKTSIDESKYGRRDFGSLVMGDPHHLISNSD